jgi:hypothetical protein
MLAPWGEWTADRWTDSQKYRQTDSQTYRQADSETDRQAGWCCFIARWCHAGLGLRVLPVSRGLEDLVLTGREIGTNVDRVLQ